MVSRKLTTVLITSRFFEQTIVKLDDRARLHREENILSDLIKDFSSIFHEASTEPEQHKKFLLKPDDCMLPQFEKAPITKRKEFKHYSPFSLSNLSKNPAERNWYYLDDERNVQGPFTTFEMDSWYNQNHFSHRLEVAFNSKESFIKLQAFLEEHDPVKKSERQAAENLGAPPGQLSSIVKRAERPVEDKFRGNDASKKIIFPSNTAATTTAVGGEPTAPKRLGFVNKKKEESLLNKAASETPVQNQEQKAAGQASLVEISSKKEEERKTQDIPKAVENPVNKEKLVQTKNEESNSQQSSTQQSVSNQVVLTSSEKEEPSKKDADEDKPNKKKKKKKKSVAAPVTLLDKLDALQESKKPEPVVQNEKKSSEKQKQQEQPKAPAQQDISNLSKKAEPVKPVENNKKEDVKEQEKPAAKKTEPVAKEPVKTINTTEVKKEKTTTNIEPKELAALIEKKPEEAGFIVNVKKTKKGQKYEILNAFSTKEQENSASKGKSLIEEVDEIVKKEKGNPSKQAIIQEKPFELQEDDFPDLEKPQRQPSFNSSNTSKKEAPNSKSKTTQKMERVNLPQNIPEKPKPVNNSTWNENPKSEVKKAPQVNIPASDDFPALKEVYTGVAKTLEASKKEKGKIAGKGTWEIQPKKEEKKNKPFDLDEEFPSL